MESREIWCSHGADNEEYSLLECCGNMWTFRRNMRSPPYGRKVDASVPLQIKGRMSSTYQGMYRVFLLSPHRTRQLYRLKCLHPPRLSVTIRCSGKRKRNALSTVSFHDTDVICISEYSNFRGCKCQGYPVIGVKL